MGEGLCQYCYIPIAIGASFLLVNCSQHTIPCGVFSVLMRLFLVYFFLINLQRGICAPGESTKHAEPPVFCVGGSIVWLLPSPQGASSLVLDTVIHRATMHL